MNIYNKIKSKYILKIIFSYINPKISLGIIKYNKKIQSKLELSLEDYKEYNQIEIDVIPIDYLPKKSNNIIFIEKGTEPYFHIYINGKERKRKKYLKKTDNAKIIKVIIDPEIKSFKYLFDECKYIKEVNIIKCNRNDIINTSFMFSFCRNLEKLNLSKLKTDNVTNMSYMFQCCDKLSELNITNIDTSKVDDYSWMFYGCISLKNFDISGFNIKENVDISSMFTYCPKELVDNIKNQDKKFKNINFNIHY